MAQCRICKIDINKEKDDWIMPSNLHYFHRKCYEDWKHSEPKTDEEYKSFIYDFISRDLKVSYDYHMIEAQLKKFVKENKFTIKGIFFTLKYFYEIKHNDWNKGHGGIGIVPYVYTEACSYWVERERKSKGVIKSIEQQMSMAATREKIIVKKGKNKPKKMKINLSSIREMEDDLD